MIYVSEANSDQYEFTDTQEALDYIEELIDENEDEIAITIYAKARGES